MKRINRNVLSANYILISLLLAYFDFIAGGNVSFDWLYIVLIGLTVIYLGSPYSYLIVLIAASERTYVFYSGFALGEPHLIAVLWKFITTLVVNVLFCYFFSTLKIIYLFQRPHNNKLLEEEFSNFPNIREFIFRPYVNRYWNMSKRLSMIATHYLLVKTLAPFLELVKSEYVDLYHFDVEGEKLRIVIDRPKWMRREGEIGISLFFGIDRIYTAMFLLSGTENDLKLIVGNLQGDGRDRTDLYKRLTKAMYGMRPRDFLVHILKIFGHELGCKELLGISDDAHRSSYWLSKSNKLAAYDEIWLEHGGIKDGVSGFFHLPARIVHRPYEEIPANKRALYRRRYQYLDDLQSQIRKFIVSHSLPAGGI